MKTSMTTVGVMALASFLTAGAARAAAAAVVVPGGGLVLDGGDAEAAPVNPFLAAPAPVAGANPFLDTAAPVPPATTASLAPAGPLAAGVAALAAQPTPAARRPIAFEYSDGYYKRLKIHKWASFATLPLFATQVVLGQKLYNGTGSDSTRSAHTAVAAGTGVLFGVNSVTGVWNLVEGRKDPNRKKKVVVHSILMLVADAGFAVSGFAAPHREDGREFGFEGSSGMSRSTHRAIALSSMGVATLSYLVMLFGR
jgi:hypothetical protein